MHQMIRILTSWGERSANDSERKLCIVTISGNWESLHDHWRAAKIVLEKKKVWGQNKWEEPITLTASRRLIISPLKIPGNFPARRSSIAMLPAWRVELNCHRRPIVTSWTCRQLRHYLSQVGASYLAKDGACEADRQQKMKQPVHYQCNWVSGWFLVACFYTCYWIELFRKRTFALPIWNEPIAAEEFQARKYKSEIWNQSSLSP